MKTTASCTLHLRKRHAWLLGAVLALATANCASGATEKDQSWDVLIAAAKARGGVETTLDRTASYVFQQPDGAYITLTRALKGGKRFVCLVAKDSKGSVCVDWDTGTTIYGERQDAASPWKNHEGPTLDEVEANKPSPLAQLLSFVTSMGGNSRGRGVSAPSHYRVAPNGHLVWVNNG